MMDFPADRPGLNPPPREEGVGLDDWRALIEFWKGKGHDIRHLEIPRDVAEALGIELPEEEIPKMSDEEMANALMTWKKKKFFPADKCGIVKCKRDADGYLMDIKPTKGGEGQLWFGPACVPCTEKSNPALKPTTLADLAKQRGGASDLALVLDVEVGEVKKRLAAAGVDEHGQPVAAPPAAPATAVPALAQAGVVASEAVTIPTEQLAASVAETNGTLTALGEFHIQNQEQMDAAAAFLAEVKGKWKAIDTLRKDLGGPLRDKLGEIQGYFKPALDALAKAEGILKQKISEGNARAQEAQRLALAAAEKAHSKGDVQATALAAQQAAEADVALPGGVSERPVVRFEITDPSQLPGNFWSPDPAKVQLAINEGHREIPGVRIWEEKIVTSRSTN
jgi:hypothetical protein